MSEPQSPTDADEPADAPPSARELAGLPAFYHPTVSPDGDRVAYYDDSTGRNELYVHDLATGERRQVSEGEVPRNARWPVAWDGPDAPGDRVFFHRDEAGDEQNDVCAIDVGTGAVEPVVEPDGQAILQDVTDDGRYVLYACDEREQLNLYRYDTREGAVEQLTSYDRPVLVARYSPDDERIAYVTNESSDVENRDAYVMDADGSTPRRLDVGTEGTEVAPVDWGPEGERLLVSDNSADLGRAGIYHLATDEVAWLSDGTSEESAVAFGPDGERVLAKRTREAATVPVLYERERGDADADDDAGGDDLADAGPGTDGTTGEWIGRELAVPEGVASLGWGGLDDPWLDGETLLVPHGTADERKGLYRYALDGDGVAATDRSGDGDGVAVAGTEDAPDGFAGTVVAPDYRDVDPSGFVDADYVTYESEDGLEIGALLFDAREGPAAVPDPGPAVVMVHGGPHSQATREFSDYVQFLVSQGYTVLQPNYRGSTGRGREFKNRIHGDWGGMEQADVAAGGRWLMARDWIDEDRVAVFGGSYGGYSAYSQATQYPTLWATAIAWIGITDLHRMYEESMPHYRTMLEIQMGDPEENRELWRDRSPIEHVDAVERPLLMIHGVNDVRCPVSQARLFRDALVERGWTDGEDGEFEYVELGEEGHGSTDVEQKTRAFELLDDYLDRRL
jgi:dipeptidyl aminopeptidase/acylaminoacyl peptidase